MVCAGVSAILLTTIIICVMLLSTASCMSPGAIKANAQIALAQTNAETIKDLRQQLFEIKNSGIIKYSGAGYVVLGTVLMAIIFLLAIGIFLKYYFKAKNATNMLGLVTTAIKDSSPEISNGIKAQIRKETSNDGKFNEQHRLQLKAFVENN